MWTYRFEGHWVTTADELTGYIERFPVNASQELAIEAGAMPNEVLGVEDPYIEPDTPPPEEETET